MTALGLQRDDEKRIDLFAVEDDEALLEAKRPRARVDAVEIAAGGKELRLTVMHDAHGEEIGARLDDGTVPYADARRPR